MKSKQIIAEIMLASQHSTDVDVDIRRLDVVGVGDEQHYAGSVLINGHKVEPTFEIGGLNSRTSGSKTYGPSDFANSPLMMVLANVFKQNFQLDEDELHAAVGGDLLTFLDDAFNTVNGVSHVIFSMHQGHMEFSHH